jgi:predicted HD superfamily hydrolase involved in NAD metabolism
MSSTIGVSALSQICEPDLRKPGATGVRRSVEPLIQRLADAIGEKRLAHSLGVMRTARDLALLYGADADKAEVAGLLHDNARDMADAELLALCPRIGIVPLEGEARLPKLLHGPIGAKLLRGSYGIDCGEIEDAVCWHTTGRAGMSLLAKIVFVADAIEPGRQYDGVEGARALAFGEKAQNAAVELGAGAQQGADSPTSATHGAGAPPLSVGHLDAAMLRIIANQLEFLLRGNSYIHPSTICAWNSLVAAE